jgi:hypothetical protein
VKRSPMKRGKAINKVNRARAAKRKARAFGDKASWIRAMSCVVRQRALDIAFDGWTDPEGMILCGGPIEVAHAKSRGAGGTSAHAVALCKRHHAQQHNVGIQTFERRYSIDLLGIARSLEKRWQEQL